MEYLPSSDKQDCAQLIHEFVDVYCNPDGPTAVPVPHGRPVSNVIGTKGNGKTHSLHWPTRSKEYTNEHCAQQYVGLFLTVIKSSGGSGGVWGGGTQQSSSATGSSAVPAASAGCAVP